MVFIQCTMQSSQNKRQGMGSKPWSRGLKLAKQTIWCPAATQCIMLKQLSLPPLIKATVLMSCNAFQFEQKLRYYQSTENHFSSQLRNYSSKCSISVENVLIHTKSNYSKHS